MTETPYINPPWDEATVEALNAYQRAGVFHPFTCGNEKHERHVILVAHDDGWHCPEVGCHYRQLWAHEFMVTPEARTPHWGAQL